MTRDTPLNFEMETMNLDLPEIQGDPLAVAENKCKSAAEIVGGAVLVEDTSLCFNALGGLPGVYVKWFLDGVGNKGLNNLLAAYEDKTATAQCIFAFSKGPGEPILTFKGQTEGLIVDARGPPSSFGWDPIFQPSEGEGKTYAEMDVAEKDKVSDRGKGFREVVTYLNTTLDSI